MKIQLQLRLFFILGLLVFSCNTDDDLANGTASVNLNVDDLVEVENATIPLTLNIGIDDYNHSGGTISVSVTGATYGTDFETSGGSESFTIDVEPQSLAVSFSIQPLDDEIIGQNKVLTISLTDATGSLELGENVSTTLTILDNDDPLVAMVGFENETIEIQENDTNSTAIAINFDQATTDGGTIVISTTSTDAIFGTDYSIDGQSTENFTLNVPAGATSTGFSVLPIDNDQFDANKRIVFTIAEVTGGLTAGVAMQTELTIINDDASPNPVIDFSADNILTYTEDSGTIVLNFVLSEATSTDATITLTATGTANSNDFNFTGTNDNPYTFTIPSGATTASVSLDIIDDTDTEDDETIILDITEVSGGLDAGLNLQQQTLTITANDEVSAEYIETFETITDLSEIGYETILIGQDASFPGGSVLKYHSRADSYADINDVNATSDNGMQIFHNIASGEGTLDHMVVSKSLTSTGSMKVNLDVAYITGINKNITQVTYYYSDTYSGSGTFIESEWNVMGTATAASLEAEGISRTQFKREDFDIAPSGDFHVAIRIFQEITPDNDVVQWRFDNIQVKSN